MARKGKMLCIDLSVFAILLLLDQYTKYLTVQKLKGRKPFVLIDRVLELQYLENRGSAFGMLQDQKFLILCIGFVFMALLLFLLLRLPADRKYIKLHVLFTMVIAGGVGNMIDRFRFDYVVDFISFVLINYPIFNVADIYIVVATLGLFFLFLFVFKEEDLEFLGLRNGAEDNN